MTRTPHQRNASLCMGKSAEASGLFAAWRDVMAEHTLYVRRARTNSSQALDVSVAHVPLQSSSAAKLQIGAFRYTNLLDDSDMRETNSLTRCP